MERQKTPEYKQLQRLVVNTFLIITPITDPGLSQWSPLHHHTDINTISHLYLGLQGGIIVYNFLVGTAHAFPYFPHVAHIIAITS